MKIIDESKLEKLDIIIKYDLKSYIINRKNKMIIEYDSHLMIKNGFYKSVKRGFLYKS